MEKTNHGSAHPTTPATPFALSAKGEEQLKDILSRYPNLQAACIPMLHLCQDENGWVSDGVIELVAERLQLSTAHVKGVVTFYTLFNQHPVGKHQVWVCRTLSCALKGSDAMIAHCEKRLGVKVGNTTKDGKVTLRTAECLAACGNAPMMQVDKEYFENLTLPEVDVILDRLVR